MNWVFFSGSFLFLFLRVSIKSKCIRSAAERSPCTRNHPASWMITVDPPPPRNLQSDHPACRPIVDLRHEVEPSR